MLDEKLFVRIHKVRHEILMADFNSPQLLLPNLEMFTRDEEQKRSVAYNGVELTTVLYEEDYNIVFEKKLVGDGKMIITFIPVTFEYNEKLTGSRYLADESYCWQEYPAAFSSHLLMMYQGLIYKLY